MKNKIRAHARVAVCLRHVAIAFTALLYWGFASNAFGVVIFTGDALQGANGFVSVAQFPAENGSLEVNGGSVLNANGLLAASGANDVSAAGAVGDVLVTGAGSVINVNSLDAAAFNSFFNLGNGGGFATGLIDNGGRVTVLRDPVAANTALIVAVGNADLDILSGGQLEILNPGFLDSALEGLIVGATSASSATPGVATVTIDGAASSVSILGRQPLVVVGLTNTPTTGTDTAQGTLSILNGADLVVASTGTAAEAIELTPGLSAAQGQAALISLSSGTGSIGDMIVDGAGSTVTVEGNSGFIFIGTDAGSVGSGQGSLSVTNGAAVSILGSVPGDSEALVGSGGGGVLQINTGGSFLVDGDMSVGDGATGLVDITAGGLLQVGGGAGSDVGIEIGANRDFDSQDSFGILNISGATSSVFVQANDAFIDVGSANTNGTGTGIGDGELNVSAGGSLLLDGVVGFGVLLGGIGGNATGAISIVDSGSNVIVTGGIGIVLIASDVDDAVGAADGSLLVGNGASLDVFGSVAGSSILGIGVGLGAGVATVSGGATVDIDGDLFVSVSNQTVFDILAIPTTGNAAQTGSLDILDTSVVTALRTTVGNNGLLTGDGTLISDSLLAEGGGIVALNDLSGVRDIEINGSSQLIADTVTVGLTGPGTLLLQNGATGNVSNVISVGAGDLTVTEDARLDIGGAGGSFINITAFPTENATLTVSDGGLVVIDDSQANLSIGLDGSGTANVLNGGQIVIQETNFLFDATEGIFVGASFGAVASDGELTVDGPTSSLVIAGTRSAMNVGISFAGSAAADGVFTVSNGATVLIDGTTDVGVLGAGRGNATGVITVTGVGSSVDVTGTQGFLRIGTDFPGDVGGTGSMQISDGAMVSISGSQFESDAAIGLGGDGSLQIDTGGFLSMDGFMIIGEGGTGVVNVLSGSDLLIVDVGGLGRDIGITIGESREGDNLDGFGELNVSGAGSSVIVQGIDAFIDVAVSNVEESGTGNAVGALNVSDGASLLVEAPGEFGGIVVGNGGSANGTLNITGSGSSAVFSGRSAIVLIATDVDMAVGAAQGNLLVTDGASLDLIGTDAGTSVLAIGMGLGDGVGVVAGGASVNVDGHLFVSASNATVLNLFPQIIIDDEPLSGNAAQTGILTISDTAVVTALRTTVGNNGTLIGDGTLVTDSLSVEAGGSVFLDNLANVQDISVDGLGSVVSVPNELLIGQSGTATLLASNGGKASAGSLSIGTGVGAMGTVSVDGFDTILFSGFSGFGGATAVGAADGANGALNVTNGAQVHIGNLSGAAFLNVAGAPGSTGDVFVASGGALQVVGNASGLLAIGSDLNSAGAGKGSLTISDSGLVTVSGTVTPGESEVLVGFGGDGSLQIDTFGLLNLDGFLSIGEGGTGTVDVSGGGAMLLADFSGAGVDVADIGIEIGLSREGDNLDGTGTLTVSGPGSSVAVQFADAFIDIAFANTAETGTGNASGQLNVTNGATLLVQADPGEIGAIVVGVGGTSSAEFNITGPGSTATITGGRGVLLVASDIEEAVGAAQGSLLVDAGATLNIFGSNPGTSVLAIGMGLGDGTGVVSGGSTVNVDGDLFVSASNATVLNLFPEIDDEPLSGNDAQTGFLTINDTASVIADFTTIGNRGTLGGRGFLVSDTFIETGGALELSGSIIGNVFNFGGTVDPGGAGVVGGTLSISGNYSQEAGLLRFSLAGNQPGEFDQLDVSGDIDLFGGAVEVELVGGATTAATNGVPLMLARGALTINEAVAFNVGAGQPAFELVPSEAFLFDPTSGTQVATQIASLNFLEQNLVDVVELASLPPNEASLAASFDDTCGNIAGVSDLSPDEQDLLAVCTDVRNAGNTPEQIAQALDALGTDEVTQTTNSTLLFTIPQHGNLSQRINGIHSGSNPIDFSGLNLRFDEHQIAGADLERFVKGLLGIGAGDADDFSKWGVFGNGNVNFGDKNATDNGNGFDYQTITMTIGADYRARDNLVFGGTLSYSDVNADFDEGGGMDLTSWAVSGFGTYFLKDKYYFDLLATYGTNEIDVSRHIVYDTVLGGTVRKATSNTDGDQVSFAFGTGYDFTPGAWVFGPHGGANYTDLETDSYTEEGAGGLNLTIDRQTATSFTANVGFHVSYTYTPEWGVITPYLRADYVREFKDDAEIIEVSFASDRFVNDPLNPSEPIRLSTDERDKEYFVYSVGASIQLIRGIAGFLNYRTAQNIEDLSLTDITWGIRFETQW